MNVTCTNLCEYLYDKSGPSPSFSDLQQTIYEIQSEGSDDRENRRALHSALSISISSDSLPFVNTICYCKTDGSFTKDKEQRIPSLLQNNVPGPTLRCILSGSSGPSFSTLNVVVFHAEHL